MSFHLHRERFGPQEIQVSEILENTIFRNMAVKWAKMLRLDLPFHGSIEETQIYKSVKRPIIAHFPEIFRATFFGFFETEKSRSKNKKLRDFMKKNIFRVTFFGFEETEKSCSKNHRKMGYNWPFWASFSRICRSRSPLSIRERAVQSGAF